MCKPQISCMFGPRESWKKPYTPQPTAWYKGYYIDVMRFGAGCVIGETNAAFSCFWSRFKGKIKVWFYGCPWVVLFAWHFMKGEVRWKQLGQSQKGVLFRVCHQVYTKTATISGENSVWIIWRGSDARNYVVESHNSSFFLSSFLLLCREAWLPGEIAWNVFDRATFACPFSHSSHTFSPLYVTHPPYFWSTAVSLHSHILWRQWSSQESPKTTSLAAYDRCLFLVSSWRLGEMGLGLVVWPFLCKTQLTRLQKIIMASFSKADWTSPLLNSLQAGPIPFRSSNPVQVSPAGWDIV